MRVTAAKAAIAANTITTVWASVDATTSVPGAASGVDTGAMVSLLSWSETLS